MLQHSHFIPFTDIKSKTFFKRVEEHQPVQ